MTFVLPQRLFIVFALCVSVATGPFDHVFCMEGQSELQKIKQLDKSGEVLVEKDLEGREEESSEVDTQDGSDINPLELFGMAQVDFGDIQTLFQQLLDGAYEKELKKAAKERRENLEVLPNQLRISLDAALDSYKNCIESVKLERCFLDFCQKIYAVSGDLISDDVEWKPGFVAGLEKFNRSLHDGSFSEMITPQAPLFNPLDIQSFMSTMMQMARPPLDPEDAFTKEDLQKLIVGLEKFIDYDKQQVDQKWQECVVVGKHLLKFLKLVQQGEVKKLCDIFVNLLKPRLERTEHNLKDAIAVLADAYLKSIQDKEDKVKKALVYWVEELKKYKGTLQSFQSLVSTFRTDLTVVMRYVSQFYDVVSSFFWYDCNVYLPYLHINKLDYSLRGAICAIGVLQVRGQMATTEMQKYLLGGNTLEKFVNPLHQKEYLLMQLMSAAPLLMNPAAFSERLHPIKKAYLTIFGALIFYYYRNLKRQVSNGDVKFWPNNDKWLKMAFTSIIRSSKVYLSSEIQNGVRDKFNPVALEKIESYSMGLLKPELVDLGFSILFVTLIPKLREIFPELGEVAELNYSDFLGYDLWFRRKLMGHCKDQAQQRGENVDNFNKGYALREGQELNNRAGFYTEFLVLHYVFKNLGFWWGSFLTSKCKGSVSGAFASVANRVSGWILGTESRDKMIEESEEGIELLKMLVSSLFQEQSHERMMVVWFLKNNGLLSHKLEDPVKINMSIMLLVLNFLSRAHLIKPTQATELLQNYRKHPDDIMDFIDGMVQKVKDNLVSATGGFVLGTVMSCLTPYVMFNYGPFYPKAKEKWDTWRGNSA